MGLDKSSQKDTYDSLYKNGDTLWDSADPIIQKILYDDFQQSLIKTREKLASGIALNVGSGTSKNADMVLKHCNNLINIDISIEGLRKSKSLNLHPNAYYVRADVLHLPFKDRKFNYVEGIAILHHLPDTKSSLREIARILMTDSAVLFVEPSLLNLQAALARKFFPTKHHVKDEKPFLPFLLKKEFEVYFKNVEIGYYSILTYGLSLVLTKSKLTVILCKILRKIDRVLEQFPIARECCGQFIIHGRKR